MANKTRPKQVVIRLTDEEFSMLQNKVKRAGSNQQEFCRLAILGKEIKNTDGIKEVVPHLSHIGNNLNQIAKRLNQSNTINTAELSQTLKGCEEIWQLLRQSIQGQM